LKFSFDSISIFQVCFPNRGELKAAVDVYIEQSCATNATNSECSIGGRSIAQTYGWPIGTWCVSQVTDMSNLFSKKDTFNEDKFPYNNAEDIFLNQAAPFKTLHKPCPGARCRLP